MKKVLLATMSLGIGGAETHIVELSGQLAGSGYKVYIISNGGVYEKEVRDKGIVHIKAPLHTKNPFSLIKSYRILKRTIIRESIDIVHAHARIPAYISNMICRRLKVPFVTTVHGEFRTSFPFNKFSRWGQFTLSVSRDINEYLIENYNYDRERADLTVNGINSDTFSPRGKDPDIMNELTIGKRDYVIGTICRIDKESSKTAFMLLDIANELAEEIDNLRLLIVGGGNQFDELNKKTEKVNKSVGKELITLTGPRSDINKLLSVMDIFTGISRSAQEAMAMQKPVVLCGDMGYLGIMDEDSREAAIETNMTCREMAAASKIKLRTDLLLLVKDKRVRDANEKLNFETIRNFYTVAKMADDAIRMYEKAFADAGEPPEFYHAILSGYYGFENSGDEAMLSSILEELKAAKPGIRLLVLSKKPADASLKYDVDTIGRANPFSLAKAFGRTGMLISGGGNLVQDVTSFQSMLYYTGLMKYAVCKGVKVMLYANGIGPLERKISRKIAASILDETDAITVREPKSLEILRELGVTKPYLAITADPVMRLDPPGESYVNAVFTRHGIPAEGKKVVFSVRPWKGLEEKYIPIFAQIADYLYERQHLMPVFIPLNAKKDTKISRDIMNEMKYHAVLVEDENSVMNLMSITGEAELVIGMRLHSLIYASVSRTPAIGIVYDPKVRNFIELTEQEDGGMVGDISLEGITAIADKIIKHRDEYIKCLGRNIEKLKKLSVKNAEIAIRLIEGEQPDE